MRFACRHLLATLFCALIPIGCGFAYTADPISARVIDAETGQPLAGVNVAALWTLKGGLEGGNVVGYANILETVTDASGTFSFPGWGPRPVVLGQLHHDAPLMLFFKPGYGYHQVHNRVVTAAAPMQTRSDWNGKAIPLTKFKGTLAEYAFELYAFPLKLGSMIIVDTCRLRELPKLLRALADQTDVFARNGIAGGPDSLEYLNSMLKDQRCGSLPQP